MAVNGAGIGEKVEQVDDFLEGVGEKLGSAVAVAGRAVVRWGGQLVNGELPAHARAEAIVAGIEEQLGDYTAAVGHGFRRVAARAKEEFDDIRAEALVKKGQWGADGSEQAEATEPSTAG